MKLPKISFLKKEKKLSLSRVLIDGKLKTCIGLSLVSAFIDIVFFSGLSKSGYPFFKWLMPAAVLLSIMSVFFSLGKFFVAIQLKAMDEIQARLKELNYSVSKAFRWSKIKWKFAHKFLISISIITSISLSVITIGNGVRRMEQNIKNLTADAATLIELNTSIKEGNSDRRNASKESIQNTQLAKDNAKAEVERYWGYVEDYRSKRDEIENSNVENKEVQISRLRKQTVQKVPKLTENNIDFISKSEFEQKLQEITKNNETDNSVEIYEQSIAYDEKEINDFILALQEKNYKMPSGETIIFVDIDGNPINKQAAISKLQNAIMEWQCDTGDTGVSSKVFTLIATYIKADENAGGLGVSEIMMMMFIMIAGIVQELLIALFTPKAILDIEMVSQFSDLLGKIDINGFMYETYKSYLNRKIIDKEDFEKFLTETKELKELTDEAQKVFYPKKTRAKKEKEFSSKVDEAIEEIEEMLK